MNSLNILSTISATPPRHAEPTSSSGTALLEGQSNPNLDNAGTDIARRSALPIDKEGNIKGEVYGLRTASDGIGMQHYTNKQSTLLGVLQPEQFGGIQSSGSWGTLSAPTTTAVFGAVKAGTAWATAPLRYVLACFFDDTGRFSFLLPIFTAARALKLRTRKRSTLVMGASGVEEKEPGGALAPSTAIASSSRLQRRTRRKQSAARTTTASTLSSDSELDRDKPPPTGQSTGPQHMRSRSSLSSAGEEIAPSRRSIRIKLHNEEALERRRKLQANSRPGNSGDADAKELVAASLKSPSGANTMKITKFPKAPLPPRPLVPRRQPSYSKTFQTGPRQKTLVIDLDETLIHSHSKGGRFATGHMVEIKMSHAVGVNGVTIGPLVPILYYVHKRPHCDEFLRKIHKWYRLVVFTASVQEYADPVIDWLEMERSYFDARYYRQHCTLRNGAYIKDLSQVEPDLSKVMILDNSPISYIFHEDNAIPIEGWISDPTDNDLLHLVPLLEGLQYVTDVRALLALRLGQPLVEAA